MLGVKSPERSKTELPRQTQPENITPGRFSRNSETAGLQMVPGALVAAPGAPGLACNAPAKQSIPKCVQVTPLLCPQRTPRQVELRGSAWPPRSALNWGSAKSLKRDSQLQHSQRAFLNRLPSPPERANLENLKMPKAWAALGVSHSTEVWNAGWCPGTSQGA